MKAKLSDFEIQMFSNGRGNLDWVLWLGSKVIDRGYNCATGAVCRVMAVEAVEKYLAQPTPPAGDERKKDAG